MLTTIVISPRERLSAITASLNSLFATIPQEQPVIVVEGATPDDIRAEMAEIARTRPFEHISLPYPVTPNVARNIGVEAAKTDYVVLADNDIEYMPGWLEAMEEVALEENADAVAPLIFIGPNDPAVIHHAGGWIVPKERNGEITMTEQHRLMNASWPDLRDTVAEHAPVTNEVCEFHCAMVRRSFLERIGGLDERLVTRDQIDFALQAKAHGAKVVFAKDAHVTYRAFDPITRLDDLHFFLFRWSDANVVASLDAFEESWSVASERERVRYGWTRSHRARAVGSYRNVLGKILGRKRTTKLLLPREERRAERRYAAALAQAPARPKAEKLTVPARTLFPAETKSAAVA